LRSFAALTLIAIAVLEANTATSAQTTASQAQKAFTHGVELQQKGDWEGARQAYETALRLAPQRVDVLSNLGLVYSQLGQQERAVKCFHDALRIDPKQYAVRFNLGIAYMRADKIRVSAAGVIPGGRGSAGKLRRAAFAWTVPVETRQGRRRHG